MFWCLVGRKLLRNSMCWVSPCKLYVGSGVVFMCWCVFALCVCLVLCVCWLVGWVWIWLVDLVGQELRFKQMCWIGLCVVIMCACIVFPCVFGLCCVMCWLGGLGLCFCDLGWAGVAVRLDVFGFPLATSCCTHVCWCMGFPCVCAWCCVVCWL